MKRMIVVAMLAFFVAAPAMAVNKENCGCGLGSMLMAENDGLVFELLATCTNGTSGNQTFGISSGTLECDKPAKLAMREKMDKFVADNMDALAVDIAMGEGETLGALAELAQIESEKKGDFYAALKANFDSLYPAGDVESARVVDGITEVMAAI